MGLIEASIRKSAERIFADVGYHWHRKAESYVRSEPYGHSKISFAVLNYAPRHVIIPFLSFSSDSINKILDVAMDLKPSKYSDSIICELSHIGMQREFEVDESGDFDSAITEICIAIKGRFIPIFNQIQSNRDLGFYIINHGYNIAGIFSYMNAISQHAAMMHAAPLISPGRDYFSSFAANSLYMKFIEQYFDIIYTKGMGIASN